MAIPFILKNISEGILRSVSTSDAIEQTKLISGLHRIGVTGSTPVVPQDVHPSLRHLKCFMIGAEYDSGGPDVSIGSPETAEFLLPMMEAVDKEPILGVFVLNPLKACGDTFDTLHTYHKKFRKFTAGCMPLMGVTAPIYISGTLIMALASALGTMAIIRAYVPDAECNVEARCWSVDMKSLNMAYGMPQMVLGDLCYELFRKFFHWGVNGCKAFHSQALKSDAQANGQRGAYAMAMALSGQRVFQYGGLLGTDMVFSPVQLMYDLELLKYVKSVTDGFDFSKESLDLDEMISVGCGGDYLYEDSTLEHYRDLIFQSELWTGGSVTNEILMSKTDQMLCCAKEKIDRIISQHSYHAPEDMIKELEHIYKCASERL